MDWLDAILRWIVYAISALVIYMLILKLTNHSPLLETVISAAVIALVVNTFRIERSLGRIDNHMETTKRTFGRVWRELDEIKKDAKRIPLIEERLNNVERRLTNVENSLGRIERKLGA